MSNADSLVDAAPCSACRSVLCTRNEECPTCSVCGERGHAWCSRGTLEPVLQVSLREAPSVRPSWELVAEDLRRREGVSGRLDDTTKAALRAVINDATERTPEVMAAETRLELDHDQAREDVKRLTKMLTRMLVHCGVTTSVMAEAEALVAEVGG